MKLKTKLTIQMIIPAVLALIIALFVTIYQIVETSEHNIQEFREASLKQAQDELKNVVGIAFGAAEAQLEQVETKEFLVDHYGKGLRNVIESNMSTIKRFYDEFKKGNLSEKEAQELAKKALSEVRYSGSNYLWVNDDQKPFPRMIMHPMKPSLNGTILNNKKFDCANERHENLFAAMVDECEDDGEGFVMYAWDKGDIKDVKKLSYVKKFEPWGWVVGTGVYVDDAVDKAKEEIKDMVRNMLWADGSNYIWINDMQRPYPKMVMHPVAPSLEGKAMRDMKYNCVKGTNQNFFLAILDVCERNGEGFVEYMWPKKKRGEPKPKLMYVKASTKLGWILGTGVHIDQIESLVKREVEETMEQINVIVWDIIYVAIVIILAIAIVAYFLSKVLVKDISVTTDFFKELAEGEGDLTKRINSTSSDEIGDMNNWFDKFIGKLNDIVSTIKDKNSTISSSLIETTELTSTIKDNSTNTKEKTTEANELAMNIHSNLESIAAATEEMSVSVSSVARNATDMKDSMKEIEDGVGDIRVAVDSVEEDSNKTNLAVNNVKGASDESAHKMKELSESALEIDSVTEIIIQIAKQTNLLAINAAIEAEVAGHAGSGFKVVAGEIKSLAKQCGEAAENISRQVGNIQNNITESVDTITSMGAHVNEVDERFAETKETIDKQKQITQTILDNVTRVSESVLEVASAIQQVEEASKDSAQRVTEATVEMKQITEKFEDVETFTNTNDEGVTEINHKLKDVSDIELKELSQLVDKFTTI